MGKRKWQPEYGSDGDEVFHVEVITKARVIEGKKFEYHVKWAGYDSNEDSWEPYKNVKDCTRLLDSFWREVGLDKRSKPGPIGQEYIPSEEWISRETQYFYDEYHDQGKGKESRKNEIDRQNRKDGSEGNSNKRAKLTIKLPALPNSSEPATTMSKPQKASNVIHISSDISDDDVPLLHKRKASLAMLSASKQGNLTDTKQQPEHSQVRETSSKALDSPDSVDSLFGDGPGSSEDISTTVVPDRNSGVSGPQAKELPAHIRRQANPKTKPMQERLTQMTGQISTKDKIVRDLGSVNEPRSSAKNKFAGMKIKKKDSAVGSSTQTSETNIQPTASVTSLLTARDTLGPSTSVGSQQAAVHPLNTNNSSNVTAVTIREHIAPSRGPEMTLDVSHEGPEATQEQVDNFLATVPHLPVAQKLKSSGNPEPQKEGATATLAKLKFEKKWKWSGELFIDDTLHNAEHLCDITITDSSEVVNAGFLLNVLLESKDSMRLTKVYKTHEFNQIYPALKRVDQFARISERDDTHKEGFRELVGYMQRGGLVTRAPVLTSYGHVAEFVIFPSTNHTLCSRLNVPASLRSNDTLVIALMPWKVPPSRYAEKKWQQPSRAISFLQCNADDDISRTIESQVRTRQSYMLASKALVFPDWLLKFIPRRAYCIWAFPVEKMPKDHGRDLGRNLRQETTALLTILNEVKAENLGYKRDVRVIFVHVGALHTIAKLPALVERRARRPEIQFYTYGSHENVDPAEWGIHEIFPLGGIVTFTYSALLENPWGIEGLINKVQKHPLWDCYVLPSVLAVFAKLSSPGHDAAAAFHRDRGIVGNIIDLVQRGLLALLRSPPPNQHSTVNGNRNDAMAWIEWQLSLLPKSSSELLEACLETFLGQHANMRESEIQSVIEEEIVRDLTALQMQPVMRKNFRRFVVIKSSQDSHIKWDRDGFEWKSLEEFDFKDDYFSASSQIAVTTQ